MLFPFETEDDGERVKWFYIPTDHGGLPMTDIPVNDQRWVYQLLSAGLSAGGYAWAGNLEAHHSHYYRVEGPCLLIEYDNFHRRGDHIHSVWRDPLGDFWRDLLTEHIAYDQY